MYVASISPAEPMPPRTRRQLGDDDGDIVGYHPGTGYLGPGGLRPCRHGFLPPPQAVLIRRQVAALAKNPARVAGFFHSGFGETFNRRTSLRCGAERVRGQAQALAKWKGRHARARKGGRQLAVHDARNLVGSSADPAHPRLLERGPLIGSPLPRLRCAQPPTASTDAAGKFARVAFSTASACTPFGTSGARFTSRGPPGVAPDRHIDDCDNGRGPYDVAPAVKLPTFNTNANASDSGRSGENELLCDHSACAVLGPWSVAEPPGRQWNTRRRRPIRPSQDETTHTLALLAAPEGRSVPRRPIGTGHGPPRSLAAAPERR